MTKLSREELCCELKEVILPVMKHLRGLVENGEGPDVIEYDHRGETIQAQFHAGEEYLTVYIMYWYGETIHFKVPNEELGNMVTQTAEWFTEELVKINKPTIERAYNFKPTLH